MTESKISITIIAHSSPNRGGIVQFCALLINELTKKNDKIELAVVGFKSLYPKFLYPGSIGKIDEGLKLKAPIKRCLTWYNPFGWIKLAWQSRQKQIVHLQLVTAFLSLHYLWFIFWLRLFSKAKVVITCHNITDHETLPLGKILNKMLLRRADHLAVHARENIGRLIEIFGINETKITFLPHGDFSFFSQWRRGKDKARKNLNLSLIEPIFLFFGYIRPYKGLRFLIEAWPRIKQSIPNAKLIIAGELWGNPDFNEAILKKQTEQNAVIYQPQYIPDEQVTNFFEASDLIILPYFNSEQTISGPLLIAMSLNLPAVVSPCGGISNMVKNDESAFFFEKGNIEQLIQKVVEAWNDAPKRIQFAINASNLAKQYSWEIVTNNYLKLFDKLII